MSAPASQENYVDVYVDESSQTKHRFLALGAMVVPSRHADLFRELIAEARWPELPHGEMAWTKVSRSKLPAYRRSVEAFFAPAPELNGIQFHSIIIDTSKIRDSSFNGGSREIGFNKEIYQLLLKVFRLNSSKLMNVYLDSRNTPIPLTELKSVLNNGARRYRRDADWPFRRVHFKESHTCNCLQIVDILLGSVAFHVNGHRQKEGASPHKSELSDHILRLARVRDAMRDTAMAGRFTIWHRQLR
ncbi:DUF3800 domain-containing protein [Bosea sp. (in: a-proteobacteria)]|uniref:DUF3800 domain-containing protein n=1 Tax=Bosea sp. (in: a-proteobacteria) TaxID=1871050 RepID=UPI0026336B4E|nr:DUF3800 domain-containing protein [Bosea sp. (in: a-proteobacteria)]MCO5092030.1 DUF3800 domain-containing protein [Bosea sp. (in: a-proteobacteria)]